MRLTRNTTQWQQTILLLCLLIIAWVLRVRDLSALSIWTDEAFGDAGARRSVLAARRKPEASRLLVAWVIGVAILTYLPLQFQRRFTEGVMGPVAVLAAIGLGRGLLRATRRWSGFRKMLARVHYPYRRARGVLLILMIVAAMPSSLYLAFGGGLIAMTRSPALFDPADVVAAVDWLGANSDWQATVFAAERTGSFIPARIGHRVYLGHPIETAAYDTKKGNVERFFGTEMADDERRALLAGCGCRFVFYGPSEEMLGSFQPGAADFLHMRYANDSTAVYEAVNVP